MNTTLRLSITAATTPARFRRNPQARTGHCPALVARGLSAVLLLALLGAGLASVARGQVITEFAIPTASSGPFWIAAGTDDNFWFTEYSANKIARITTAGVVTEFSIPTADSLPVGIAAGPDGNLWFTENGANKIGRITMAGIITEFSTAGSAPYRIAAGPDGNLWFTHGVHIGRITTSGVITEFGAPGSALDIAPGADGNVWFTYITSDIRNHHLHIGRITTAGVVTGEFFITSGLLVAGSIAPGPDGNLWFTVYGTAPNKIGRITAGGVITEFPIPSSFPLGIAAGPDGNLWFTEYAANQIGRITTAGVITEFSIPTAGSAPHGIATGPDGNLWFTEANANRIGRITTDPTTPRPMAVDAHAVIGSISNANGVLESGEAVQIDPSWKNTLIDPQTFTGTASNLSGPPGPTYTINDGSADYGTVNAGTTGDCNGAAGDCYLMTVSGARPAAHWDATFTEDLSSNSITKVRTLHVGESFPDVPTSDPFYGFIENLFHNGVTGGCAGGNYCPDALVTRAQIAAFLLKGKFGWSQTPPPATGTVFNDVHVGDPFADWIEKLAGFKITGGCGNGNYCPNNPVTRAQMAAFLLKAKHGSAFTPLNCTGVFADVTCPSQFANWIEQLFAEGITAGCGGGNYCPDAPNTRGQMAVFLVKTFGLELYEP